LLVRIRDGTERAPSLISLRNIPELRGIEVGEPTRIGAATPVADLVEHAALGETYPVLVEAARRIGSAQIRNAATIGGNLCNASPCADTAPPLLVLDARVRVEGPAGSREVPLEEFFVAPGETRLAPGEVLTHVLIDRPPPGARARFLKHGRVRMDLALVSVAALLATDEGRATRVRVAAGSVAPRPVRLHRVEELLEGEPVTSDLVAEAGALAREEIAPISDVRASAEYRRDLTEVLTRRALGSLAGEEAR
jgi:carbon-monoxide dehydrogenase medium subunit